MPDPLIGQVLGGRYEIVSLIDSGGMGRVYRARQRGIDRAVAVKVIHPHLLTDERVIERFLVEAQAASRLDHPNVVAVHEFGRTAPNEGGHFFLAMELLDGVSLGRILYEALLPLPRVSAIVRQVLSALEEAHQWGVTHRDIKPDNVVVDARRGADLVKVIDFGIAVIGSHAAQGQACGTPEYMSPEQICNRPIGPQSDIYSVGAMLYEMLTGQPPFVDESNQKVFAMHMNSSRPNPCDTAPMRRIPAAVGEACVRAMAYDPEGRFPDAAAFAQVLEAAFPVPLGAPGGRGLSTLPPAMRARKNTLDLPSLEALPTPPEHIHKETLALPGIQGPPPSARRAPAVRLRNDTLDLPGLEALPPSSREAGLRSPWPHDRRPIPPAAPSPPSPSPSRPLPTGQPRPAVPTDSRPSVVGPPRASVPTDPRLTAIVGREIDLAWSLAWLDDRARPPAVVLYGRTGVGCSRLLRELAVRAGSRGWLVLQSRCSPPPFSEVGYHALRQIVAELAGTDTPALSSRDVVQQPEEHTGIALLFDESFDETTLDAAVHRRAVGAALRWAVGRAVERSQAGRVLLCVDDAHTMDGPSLLAVTALLDADRVEGLTIVLTSEIPPDDRFAQTVAARRIRGLSSADACQLVDPPLREVIQARKDEDIEGIYVDQLRRWSAEAPDEPMPPTLEQLIDARIRWLSGAERRLLQAMSVLGEADAPMIGQMVGARSAIVPMLRQLDDAGFVRRRFSEVSVGHALLARLVLAGTPAGILDGLHSRAASALTPTRRNLELRAHHLLRTAPGFDSYLLVDEVAKLRTLRDDREGVAAALFAGLGATDRQALHGDVDGANLARRVFARKLGATLVELDRVDEGIAVMTEALEASGPRTLASALLMEQLWIALRASGQLSEAERLRRTVMDLAEAGSDHALLSRLSSRPPRVRQQPAEPTLFPRQ